MRVSQFLAAIFVAGTCALLSSAAAAQESGCILDNCADKKPLPPPQISPPSPQAPLLKPPRLKRLQRMQTAVVAAAAGTPVRRSRAAPARPAISVSMSCRFPGRRVLRAGRRRKVTRPMSRWRQSRLCRSRLMAAIQSGFPLRLRWRHAILARTAIDTGSLSRCRTCPLRMAQARHMFRQKSDGLFRRCAPCTRSDRHPARVSE